MLIFLYIFIISYSFGIFLATINSLTYKLKLRVEDIEVYKSRIKEQDMEIYKLKETKEELKGILISSPFFPSTFSSKFPL